MDRFFRFDGHPGKGSRSVAPTWLLGGHRMAKNGDTVSPAEPNSVHRFQEHPPGSPGRGQALSAETFQRMPPVLLTVLWPGRRSAKGGQPALQNVTKN